MGAPYALSSDLVSAWPAKSLEVAQYIDGQLPLIAMTQNAQTGTTYTLAATDFTKLVTLSNASPVTVTVPLESSVAWVAGTQLRLMNLGAGVVTVVGAGGVTINGSPLTLAQFKEGTLTKTGTNTWTFTGSASAPGMDLITPTSVAGSGVTLSGGKVSFSAATAVSVNGCFTAAYDNYIVQCVALSSGSGTDLKVRLRSAGTDNTAANYDLQYGDVSSTTANGGRSTGQTGWVTAGNLDTGYGLSTMTFGQPFLAASTVMTLFGGGTQSSAYLRSSFNRHTASTSFDGFTMYVISGNMTGTLRVYGLRNS